MHNTWWITRPKRNLISVPLCLAVIAHHAQGKKLTPEVGLAIEKGFEEANIKRKGKRRDQGAGGGRTYRAWMKSLGLIFMDDENKLWLTSAGEALINAEPPLEILKKQVLSYQYPSAYTASGKSQVASRFKVRPFIFLLQLLLDERLGGYLHEREEVAKIVIAYGETNKQADVDKVVEMILKHRQIGDDTLPADYLEQFVSSDSKKNATRESLFKNNRDIANTLGNWLGYTQLIQRERSEWRIPDQARAEVQEIIREYTALPLIKDHDNEEKYQRRYGRKPGQIRDDRVLDSQFASRTSAAIEADRIKIVMMEIATTELINEINLEVVEKISRRTGSTQARVEQVLAEIYPNGATDTFMQGYVHLAFQSRDKATEFEKATAEIFRKVFGFNAQQMGQQGLRPDIVISSDAEDYAGIIDNKAYKEGYSLTHGQRNAMRTYIESFDSYKIDDHPLRFFCYVVSDVKSTMNSQLKDVAEANGVAGSAITARDIVRLARMQDKPSHAKFLELFTSNQVVDVLALAA